jgi:hypothetical protein
MVVLPSQLYTCFIHFPAEICAVCNTCWPDVKQEYEAPVLGNQGRIFFAGFDHACYNYKLVLNDRFSQRTICV